MILTSLVPTHNTLRKPTKVISIMEAIDNYQFENKEPCTIVRVNDVNYIWNGHHRLKSLYLLGIDIDRSPFPIEIKTMKYEELVSINFAVGYVTPFCPVSYCRKPEFFVFKKRVMNIFREWGFQDAIDYISNRYSEYAEPRTVHSLEELS
jgi:hypothetical protein